MKSTTIAVIFVLAIIAVGAFFFAKTGVLSGSVINADNGNSNTNGETQKVVISYKNYNYYPQEIRVKAGIPVSISLDNSVVGCFRYFTIRDLGLSKNLATPSDTLTFTPTKKGTYRFACGMGMGYGTLIVE